MTRLRILDETKGPESIRYWQWADAGGLVAPLVALALWALVLVGVAAPLGTALARFDAVRANAVASQASCAVPPGALASASRPGDAPARCR